MRHGDAGRPRSRFKRTTVNPPRRGPTKLSRGQPAFWCSRQGRGSRGDSKILDVKLSSQTNILATAAITPTTIRRATTKRNIVASTSNASQNIALSILTCAENRKAECRPPFRVPLVFEIASHAETFLMKGPTFQEKSSPLVLRSDSRTRNSSPLMLTITKRSS
jgi:hypothetical protein